MDKNITDYKFNWAQVKVSFANIYKHSKYYKKSLLFIFVLIALSSTFTAISPYVWGKLVDSILSQKSILVLGYSIPQVYLIFSGYVLMLLLQLFIDFRKSLSARWVEQKIKGQYLDKSSVHILKLPMHFHKSSKQGEVNEKIGTAAQSIRDIFSVAILESLPQLTTAIIMCVIVVSVSWVFGLVIGTALVLYFYFSIKEIKPTFALQKESQRGYRKASGLRQDAMNNIRTVKDFNTEDFESSRINKVYEKEGFDVWYKMFQIQRTTNSKLGFIRIGARCLVIYLCIVFISKGMVTVGAMLAYISYVTMIFEPLTNIFNNWRSIQNGIVAIDEAEKIMNMSQENYEPTQNATKIDGNIEFKNVDFYYDEENPVLKNINFSVKQGETVALIGESGVGKSTLVDLILGYHFAKAGRVIVDGVDLTQISLNTLREETAVVSQEISLFNDTIQTNISYGSFDKTLDEVIEASRKAHCIDFIEKFPLKWEQVVGEKGLKLSVGQKQRVAIARAILKNPKILILDEPTSALDAGSEQVISESFKELMKGRTTFVIAHRLSTVREADMILVFKAGEIVERGRHEELIKIEGGEYRRLYELQIGLSN